MLDLKALVKMKNYTLIEIKTRTQNTLSKIYLVHIARLAPTCNKVFGNIIPFPGGYLSDGVFVKISK